MFTIDVFLFQQWISTSYIYSLPICALKVNINIEKMDGGFLEGKSRDSIGNLKNMGKW